MKTLAYLFILSSLASCVGEAPIIENSRFVRSAPMRWDDGFPKTVRISEDFSEEQRTVITNTAEAWNKAVGNKIRFYEQGDLAPRITPSTNLLALDTDDTFGVYLVNPSDMPNSDQPGAYRTIAVTLLKLQTQNYGQANMYNKIFFTDIYVRKDLTFRNETTHSGYYNSYDLNAVMVHEFGHALGLEHTPSPKSRSIMYDSIDENDARSEPLPYDIQQISDKYNIPTGITPSAAAMAVKRPDYTPEENNNSPFVRYIIELRSDGECIHSVDGKVVERHKR